MSGSVLTIAADEFTAALVRDAFLVVAIDPFPFDLLFPKYSRRDKMLI